MKQVSAEVLNLDVQKLIEMLNAALCEEWLAYYQYWVGARVTEGPMRSEIESIGSSSSAARPCSVPTNG